MSVAKVSKLFIISHKSDTEAVLKKLRKIPAPVEINPYKGEIGLEIDDSGINREHNIKVRRALDILSSNREEEEKKVKKALSRAGKLAVKRSEYEEVLKDMNFDGIVESVLETEDEIEELREKIAGDKPKISQLEPWLCYRGKIEDIKETDKYTIKLGVIHYGRTGFKEILENLKEKNIICEKISENKGSACVILAYHNHFRSDAEEYIRSIEFEEAGIAGYKGTVRQNLDRVKKCIKFYKKRIKKLKSELNEISLEYEKPFTVYLDYIENNLEIDEAVESGFSTASVSFHTAWVKESEREKIISIIDSFQSVRAVEVQPEEDENIPVILENRSIFRPFEIIVNLYGVPRYFEIDPTPFVSLFFALFLGLCLTDAGYGIILAILTLVFAFKMKSARKFLMLIFTGAVFAIFAGAIFNGWFGDLPEYLGAGDFFSRFAILGDPVKSNESSMNFFRLALAVGVIQVVFGLFIKFFDNIRRRDWEGAFLDGLPWIIIILPLVLILLSTQIAVDMKLVSQPLFSAGIIKFLIWPIIIGAIIIIFFAARDIKSWGFRIFMGFLNLTVVRGLTSFLGDFLSYVRLMALGLVTAGIGVAINRIAFQFVSVPVAGILILIVVLVFGHIFNIGISVLSGFVHTLRLQYVEFFPKFFMGGGRPFRSLKDEHRYITIID
ncbi:MAG: V-type ATP synthase subunit I [Actinomycetota bacterium]|nr:V-type ATP synthase subunit I [Actinomycetota bacterium]